MGGYIRKHLQEVGSSTDKVTYVITTTVTVPRGLASGAEGDTHIRTTLRLAAEDGIIRSIPYAEVTTNIRKA